MLELNKLYHMDCMEGMAEFPDKYFELAIVDPPYGGGNHHQRNKRINGTKGYSYGTKEKCDGWDIAPGPRYFEELFRVSQYQIIWGGNYFSLPPMRNFIIYYKSNIPAGFDMANCEYGWTNIPGNSRIYNHFAGIRNPLRFHPTQKPVALYRWLLKNYARPGDRILDTHAGSASSLVACHEMGFQFIGFELDADYYRAANERLINVQAQKSLFDNAPPVPAAEQLEMRI